MLGLLFSTPYLPDSQRSLQKEEESQWNGMKQIIAFRGLMAKFLQNENLKNQLLSTGNAYLVECAYKDTIWACGIRIHETDRHDRW